MSLIGGQRLLFVLKCSGLGPTKHIQCSYEHLGVQVFMNYLEAFAQSVENGDCVYSWHTQHRSCNLE